MSFTSGRPLGQAHLCVVEELQSPSRRSVFPALFSKYRPHYYLGHDYHFEHRHHFCLYSYPGKNQRENFFRVVFYIPNILSIAVIAAVFSAIYAPDQGLINGLGRLLNPDTWVNIQFLGNPRLVVYSVIGAMVWQALGYYMVMYMASMGSIPTHLYEAAQIEGANRVRQFVDITLPLIWETVRTTLVFFIISSINISFLLVNVLTGGGPNGASEVFLSYLYRQAYNNASYGYGMAIGVVVFLFSFALAGLVSLVTKRDVVQY